MMCSIDCGTLPIMCLHCHDLRVCIPYFVQKIACLPAFVTANCLMSAAQCTLPRAPMHEALLYGPLHASTTAMEKAFSTQRCARKAHKEARVKRSELEPCFWEL